MFLVLLLFMPCSLSNLQSQASKDVRLRCDEKLCLTKSLKLPRMWRSRCLQRAEKEKAATRDGRTEEGREDRNTTVPGYSKPVPLCHASAYNPSWERPGDRDWGFVNEEMAVPEKHISTSLTLACL